MALAGEVGRLAVSPRFSPFNIGYLILLDCFWKLGGGVAGEIDLVHQPRFLLRQGRNVLQDGDGSIIHKVARSRHSRRFIENTWMLLEFRKYTEIVIDFFFFLSFFIFFLGQPVSVGGNKKWYQKKMTLSFSIQRIWRMRRLESIL